MKFLLIARAGDFLPEVEEMARLNENDIFVYVDDNPEARCHSVIGTLMFLPTLYQRLSQCNRGVGNNLNGLLQTRVLMEVGIILPRLSIQLPM